MTAFAGLVSGAHQRDLHASQKRAATARQRRGAVTPVPGTDSRFYLVCYDTPDQRRRRRMARVLESWGVRVQWSVFECRLSAPELLRLTRALDRVVDEGADDVRIFECAAAGQPPHPRLACHVEQARDCWAY